MRAALVGAVLAAALLSGCADGGSDGASHGGSDEPSRPEVTELDAGPVGVADVDGEAWTVLVRDGTVRTADDERIEVGEFPLRLVTTPSGVWVSVIGDGAVVRIDPGTGEVDKTVTLKPKGSEPEGLAWDGESLWVVDQAGGRVVQLDANGAEVASFKTDDEPRLVAAGESAIARTSALRSSATTSWSPTRTSGSTPLRSREYWW